MALYPTEALPFPKLFPSQAAFRKSLGIWAFYNLIHADDASPISVSSGGRGNVVSVLKGGNHCDLKATL